MKKTNFALLVLVALTAFFSCKKDDTSCEATYETNVQAIIDKSCAYAGCHAGTAASPWVPEGSEDYTNFEGMIDNLTSGLFTERVLELRNMPDSAWVPEDRPTELTAEEIEILTCWKDNGFPKN